MSQKLRAFWQNYKFRFVPWLAMNLKPHNESQIQQKEKAFQIHGDRCSNSSDVVRKSRGHQETNVTSGTSSLLSASGGVKQSSSSSSMIIHHVHQGEDKQISDDELIHILVTLFEAFLISVKDATPKHLTSPEVTSKRNMEIMHNILGYSIERRKSMVAENAGTGVFLASGHAKPGSLIALYPGTIYTPSEPLFFPSIGNPFIFRCSDQVHIDGNDRFLSKSIFSSCAARDRFRLDLPCCDVSWLTQFPVCPLNIGQYVNNRSRASLNNVVYQESNLTIQGSSITKSSQGKEFPVELCRFLPNAWSNPTNNQYPLRLVPLVAIKDIWEGEEILSSYFTVVHSKDNGKLAN